MTVELITTLVIILAVVLLLDKLYRKINLAYYSPVWEYFLKAMLYGFIAILTMFYGKESLSDISSLEWAIVAVSGIEGIGNYVNFIKEVNQRRAEKSK